MPKMGESIIEATILKWTKQPGEQVEQEETVLEIATDKVDSEVPAPADGRLVEVRYKEGDVVPVGEVIAIIETVSEEEQHPPHNNGTGEAYHEPAEKQEVPYVPVSQVQPSYSPSSGTNGTHRFFSPLVLNIARKEGISMDELEKMPGTGRGGRVTKKDILHYVAEKPEGESWVREKEAPALPQPEAEEVVDRREPIPFTPPVKPAPETQVTPPKPKLFAHSGDYEIEEMDRMRKMIAQNMLASTQISAHVTSFVEADVTALVQWRARVKNTFEKKYGEKLTFTPLFVQAVAQVLREFPRINASVEDDKILLKKSIHIGIAVALPDDNLIVPVVKHADRMNLVGLTAAINDLASRARARQLKPEELEGGTYSVSNVGTFGNVMGTPIILQPQLAILATGAIRKLPAVIETPEGDVIGIRNKMFLSHSYDHRVIDGALGGKFVRRVADLLEAWDPNTPV